MKPLTRTFSANSIILLLVALMISLAGWGQNKTEITKSYNNFLKNYPGFSTNSIKTIQIVSSGTTKGGKTIFMLTVDKSKYKQALPASFNVSINNTVVKAIDTGKYPDESAGDGIFTIVGSPKGNFNTTETYLIQKGILTPVIPSGSETAKLTWKCKAKLSTNCPNCRGPIFGGPCVVCVVIDCEVIWEGTVFDW
jgi:hypothetical protein